MDDLITWLRAQLDEDEVVAQDAARWYGDSNVAGLAPRWRQVPVGHVWNDQDGGIADADNVAALPHIVNFDPARVLREVEAKRRQVELHKHQVEKITQAPFDPMTGERRPDEYEVTCEVCGWSSDDPTSACETLRLLALPFSDRPGYREEWKL